MEESSVYDFGLDVDLSDLDSILNQEEISKRKEFIIQEEKAKRIMIKLKRIFISQGLALLDEKEDKINFTSKAFYLERINKNFFYKIDIPKEIVNFENSEQSSFIANIFYSKNISTSEYNSKKIFNYYINVGEMKAVLVVEYKIEKSFESIIFNYLQNGFEFYFLLNQIKLFVPTKMVVYINNFVFKTIDIVMPEVEEIVLKEIFEKAVGKKLLNQEINLELSLLENKKKKITEKYNDLFRDVKENMLIELPKFDKIKTFEQALYLYRFSENLIVKLDISENQKCFDKYIGKYLVKGIIKTKVIDVILVKKNQEVSLGKFSFDYFEKDFGLEKFLENCKVVS